MHARQIRSTIRERLSQSAPLLAALLLAGGLIRGAALGAEPSEPTGTHVLAAREHLAHARTQKKFGIVEHGNVQAFDAALAELDAADRELTLAAQSGEDAAKAGAALQADVLNLRSSLEQLRSSANAVFAGRFPLFRALNRDKGSSDDLSVAVANDVWTARRVALRAALAEVVRTMPSEMLTAVVLVPREDLDEKGSAEFLKTVDSEAALAFGASANVTLFPSAWRDELPRAPAWNEPDAAFVPHCRQVMAHINRKSQSANLMFVLVRSAEPLPTQNEWFEAQWRLFKASAVEPLVATPATDKLEADEIRVSEGLCRDQGPFIVAIVVSIVALALAAFIVYAILNTASRHVVGTWQTWVIPPAIGFGLGMLSAPMVVTVLRSLAPDPATLAGSAAWWPCLTGALMLLVPAIVFRLGAKSIASIVPGLYLDGRWGMTFAAVGLGVCGYCCRAAYLCLGWNAVQMIVPLAIAAALALYLFGRAVDDSDHLPLAFALVAIPLALAVGLGAFLASPAVLWSTAGAGGLVTLGLLLLGPRTPEKTPAAPVASRGAASPDPPNVPSTLAELRAHAQSPSYQPVDAYARASAQLEPAARGKTVWLGLSGASGSGKTALVRELVAKLRDGNTPLQLLSGNCRAEAPPYQPFREALADVWGTAGFDLFQPQTGKFDSVLQDFVGMFVPYLGMLSSFEHAGGASASSPTDLFAAVASTLRRLARKQTVVLVLDNVQWLDERSAALLRHLEARFPAGGDVPLLVLLAGRDETNLSGLNLGANLISVAVPGPEDQAAILINRLRLEPESARKIVSSLETITHEPGGLFWLCRAVAELVDGGAIEPTAGGFALRAGFPAAGKLPVPAELRQLLAARLRDSAKHQFILECSALLGEVFRASDVAEALGSDRLELLQTFRQLESDQRIVRDVSDSDDLFAFSSPFVLEVVRHEFGIHLANGAPDQLSKIARELHARVAAALEQRADHSAADTYAIARHYFHAGARHARHSAPACLRAARMARGEFAYQDARAFLEMAAKSAAPTDDAAERNLESLLIDCDEAHVTGRDRVPAATRAVDFLVHYPHPTHELLAAVALACCEAGRDTGDAKWFTRAAQVSQQIVAEGQTSQQQADGYHLLGVSLPPDRRAERIAALERGLALLEGAASNDRPALLLQTRLIGALAEALSQGSPADRQRAAQLFARGLALRQEHHLGDLPGQSRAFGGLGRLAFSANPADYAAARRYFAQDLAISEQIGDVTGVSLCHSFLARCDHAEGNLSAALEHYRQAASAAPSPKDRYFAAAGLLEVLIDLDQPAEVDRIGREILALAKTTPIPRDCAEQLSHVLTTKRTKLRGDWVDALNERLAAALSKPN